MSYPAIIESTGTAVLSAGQGWNAGPFQNGANLYAILQGEPAFSRAIAVYKSTDTGQTWTLMDAAHEITDRGAVSIGWLTGFQSGTRIYCAYYGPLSGSNAVLFLVYFDMSTDLWTTGVASQTIGFVNSDALVGTYKEITFRNSGFVRRSDNSFVLPYVGKESVSGTFYSRTYFDVWTGSAWTVVDGLCGENGTANRDLVVATILGSGDRTHVFYVEYNTKTLKQRTITSTNTVVAAVTVASVIFDPGGTNTQSLGESIGYPAYNPTTSEIAIPYKDVNGNCKVARATSADSPTFTSQQVDTTIVLAQHAQSFGSQVSMAFYSGSPATLSVAFLRNSSLPFKLYRVDNAGGTWGTPALELTGANNAPVDAIGGIGFSSGKVGIILWDDLNGNFPVCYWQDTAPPPPPAGSVFQPPPIRTRLVDAQNKLTIQWATWFHLVYAVEVSEQNEPPPFFAAPVLDHNLRFNTPWAQWLQGIFAGEVTESNSVTLPPLSTPAVNSMGYVTIQWAMWFHAVYRAEVLGA